MGLVSAGECTSPQFRTLGEDPSTIGVVAIGAIEQHGPHIPLLMDTRLTEAIIDELGARVSNPLLTMPTVTAGMSQHHLAFPGTVTIDPVALRATLDAHVDALVRVGVKRIALLSGHGGNFRLLSEIAGNRERGGVSIAAYADVDRYLSAQRAGARAAGLDPAPTDIHSGVLETSVALELFGDRVQPFDDVEGYLDGDEGWMDRMSTEGIHSLSRIGVLGQPRGATAGAGRLILEAIGIDVAEWLQTVLGAELRGFEAARL